MSKTKRQALSVKTRFEVFKRDGFRCQYCGATPPGVLLQVDHINAVARGGKNDTDNLITSCQPCNAGKGARPLDAVPQSLQDRAAEVAEREAQLQGYQFILEARRQRLEDETWRVLNILYPGQDSVPRESHASTLRFIEKLGVHSCMEAAEIAMASRVSLYKVFRYFCGICWNRIRGDQP